MKKSKFFNNSTKRTSIETQAIENTEEQTLRKSKRKALRGFAFGGVALMMATAGVFAFAPLGNVAPASLEASQPTDVLVTPQEDDPVLFTTEDGLEIKWGNAASIQGGGKETASYNYTTYTDVSNNISSAPTHTKQNLSSGNLSGFPYFTTTSGSTTYTWVIIGRNSNVSLAGPNGITNSSYSSAKIEYKTLNDWKAKIGNSDTYDNFVAGYSPTYKSFFNNTYETSSPAGAAINNNGLLSAVTARNYSASATIQKPVSAVKTNAEIPSGCVLVLANGNVATGVFNTSYSNYSSSYWGGSYKGSESIATAMEGYYTNGTYGLSAIKSRIQAVTLSTYTYVCYRGSSSMQWQTHSAASKHVFPLGAHSSSTFYWANYLTAAQIKLTANQWIRGNGSGTSGRTSGYYYNTNYLNTSGAVASAYCNNSGPGYRPAFVLKVT